MKRMHRAVGLAVALAVVLPAAACTGGSGSSPAGPSTPTAAPSARGGAASGGAAAPFPVAENKRPGTSAWRITDLGAAEAIDGYADQQSVLPGQSFRLYVSTTASSFRVDAFRFGWYSGHQARLVWASAPVRGQRQTAVRTAAGTHMVTAPWRPSLTVSTASWPPGSYLLRLDASSGAERYVPITVRSASTAGAVVILNDNTTWQAYNTWGGYSLYQGPDGLPSDRGYAVSFDRPYDGDGAVRFLAFDQSAIAQAERTGIPLAYETDVDLDQHPGLLAGARAVITLGHDEYYSLAMRNALTQARNAGTNLAFLGANAIYRHIRFAAGDRVIICYKAAALDPLFGKDNARDHPAVARPARPAAGERPRRGVLRVQPGERALGGLRPVELDLRRHRRLQGRALPRHGGAGVRPAQPGRAVPPAAAGARAFPADLRRFLHLLRFGVLHGRERGRGVRLGYDALGVRDARPVLRAWPDPGRRGVRRPGHCEPAPGLRGGSRRAPASGQGQRRPGEAAAHPGSVRRRRLTAGMDDIDAQIVAALIRDARASYALIGGEVGLSAPAVKRRVDRLRASGAITGFSARVDPVAMGWTTEGYVELYCGGRTSPEEIGTAVRRYPEVVDACTVTGEADALVHIRAADVRHFEEVMERIRAEPFVVRTKSVIVLSRLVDRADALAPLR